MEKVQVKKTQNTDLSNFSRTPISLSNLDIWLTNSFSDALKEGSAPEINLIFIRSSEFNLQEETNDIRTSRVLSTEARGALISILAALKIRRYTLEARSSFWFNKLPEERSHLPYQQFQFEAPVAYEVSFRYFSLYWRYFPQSGSTIGILLDQARDLTIALKVFKQLQTHIEDITQPLLLHMLAHNAVRTVVNEWYLQQTKKLLNEQIPMYRRLWIDNEEKDELNYSFLSAKVSSIASKISVCYVWWQGLEGHARFIIEENTKFQEDRFHPVVCSSRQLHWMTAHAEHLLRVARYGREDAALWQKKAAIQLQVLFNLIAQEDQNTNIKIASASKRDSTSMKAIAAVTMAFLPGTFVATLLSMDIFKWDANEASGVISARFWIYWAITVPLTLLTFVTWGLWMRYLHEGKSKDKLREL